VQISITVCLGRTVIAVDTIAADVDEQGLVVILLWSSGHAQRHKVIGSVSEPDQHGRDDDPQSCRRLLCELLLSLKEEF